MRPLAQVDLDHVLERTAELWPEVRGERILLTGGTGFFGSWLTETFLHANRTLGLGARLFILSRDPQAFRESAPFLCHDPALHLFAGDIRAFPFPDGSFACIVHAATDSIATPDLSEQGRYSVILDGTRRICEFARAAGAGRLLLASSGSVYGQQPADVTHMSEEQTFARTEDAYTLGKRDAEALCMGMQSQLQCTVARGFAFLGPQLRLDAHFAAGNFLRDALSGRDIAIKGDGSPLRSYLYAADLTIWLWTILFKGSSGRAYNVGSEEQVSISQLAQRIAGNVNPDVRVLTGRRLSLETDARQRYVPSTRRAQSELGLAAWIGLDEAIRRTAAWHRSARWSG